MILLDTNVISELMRSECALPVLAWAYSVPAEQLQTTAVTEGELRAGAAKLPEGRRRQGYLHAIAFALAVQLSGRVLPFDRAAALHFAEFTARRRAAAPPAVLSWLPT